MKAFRAIGFKKAFKYLSYTFLYLVFRALPLSPLRTAFLRLLGARVGGNTIVHNVKFFNYYRTGFSGLTIGDDCFIGDDCLLDLASPLTLEDKVTLAERVLILTHLNVGYDDHPMQRHFPPTALPVLVKRGSFLGAGVTVLNGVTIGPESFVAACALVNADVGPRTVVGGVPARVLRELPA